MNNLKRLWFGNLDFRTTETQLGAWLREWGVEPFNVRIVGDRSGSLTVFGFAEFVEEDARRALRLSGKFLGGRALRVAEAKAREKVA